jgi:hypothetical protein
MRDPPDIGARTAPDPGAIEVVRRPGCVLVLNVLLIPSLLSLRSRRALTIDIRRLRTAAAVCLRSVFLFLLPGGIRQQSRMAFPEASTDAVASYRARAHRKTGRRRQDRRVRRLPLECRPGCGLLVVTSPSTSRRPIRPSPTGSMRPISPSRPVEGFRTSRPRARHRSDRRPERFGSRGASSISRPRTGLAPRRSTSRP